MLSPRIYKKSVIGEVINDYKDIKAGEDEIDAKVSARMTK